MIELCGDWKSIERMDTYNQNFIICMAEKNFAMKEEANGNCVIIRNRLDFNVAYAAYKGKLYDLIEPNTSENYCHRIYLYQRSAKTYTRNRYQCIPNNPENIENAECVPVITKEHNYYFGEKYRPMCILMEKGYAYMVRLNGLNEYIFTRYQYGGDVCEEEHSYRFHWQHDAHSVISNNVNITDPDGDHLSVSFSADSIEIPSIRGLTDTRRRSIVPEIDRVTWNSPATVVFWKDGTKTVVKCGDKDDFDKEKGLAMAFMKKVLGNKGNYYNYIRKWLPEEKPFSDPDPWKNVDGIFDSVTTELEAEVKVKDKYIIKLKNGTEIKCTRDEVPFFMTAVRKFMKPHPDSQK